MAKREISIVLKAKNQLQAGLANAGAQLKSFGAGVLSVGKSLALSFASGTAALAATMVKAQEFNKQIGQISTVSDLSFSQASSAVRKLSAEFGLAKEELTKGLYDALSKGVPQENVFDFMATASKTAIAGATTTSEAVDFLTSAMNAFQIPASEADKVADTLFQTVKLGGTTVTELASSFGKVGSLAAASGVELEQVMSALATLTKTGNGTAESTTMIRAAIIAMNKELGDGWAKTMTLQEGMQAMSDRANGSQNELRAMTGSVEAMNGILGMTGQNAQMAASDLDSVANAAGAASEAFGKMGNINPIEKAVQAFNNLILVIGDNAIKALGPYIELWAKSLAEFAEELQIFADGGGFIKLIADVQLFGANFKRTFMMVSNTIHGNIAVIYDFVEPLIYVGKVAVNTANVMAGAFTYAGQVIGAAAHKALKPWTKFQAPDTAPIINAFNSLKDAATDFNAFTINNTRDAQAVRIQIEQEYADTVKKINERRLVDLKQHNNLQVEQAENALEKVAQIEDRFSNRTIDLKQNEAREIAQVAQEAATQKTEIEQRAVNRIVEENIRAKDEVTNAWRSGVNDFRNAEEEKVNIAVGAAQRIQAAQASVGMGSNTGFNEGLLGQTFETGGGDADYQQALANLRARGFQIGGMVTPGAQIAGVSDIVAELRRIREQNDSLLRLN